MQGATSRKPQGRVPPPPKSNTTEILPPSWVLQAWHWQSIMQAGGIKQQSITIISTLPPSPHHTSTLPNLQLCLQRSNSRKLK